MLIFNFFSIYSLFSIVSILRTVGPYLFTDLLTQAVKGTLRRRLAYIFFSFNKKFNIITFSPTKFGLSIFTVREQKFEVSF